LKKVKAFSPGHITGFFQIVDAAKDPLLIGSRGAGVSISRGVKTTVEIHPNEKSQTSIKINGQLGVSAPVSEHVLAQLLSRCDRPYLVNVDHEVSLPIGCGFGTSGAAALSLSLAANEALELELTKTEAAQIAHIAEVECKTGLGTVIAEFVGGIEIRITAGGPGYGSVETLPNSEKYSVICLPFGPIPTPTALSDPDAQKRINEKGEFLTDALRANPTVEKLLKFSRHFAEHIDIITPRIQQVLQTTDEEEITCSTAIFGENVFTIVPHDEVQKVENIFKQFSKNDTFVMTVDNKGARLVNG
jgi:pantoate kinase